MAKFLLLSLFLITLVFPKPTFAHAFGQLYNLPVPFWLYLYGAAAAIVASFLVIGFFLSKKTSSSQYPTRTINLPVLTNPVLINLLKVITLILFVATLLSGFIGSNNPRLNFNMTFFWIIFTLGFAYFVAIFGNLWEVVNPWKVFNFKGVFTYPKKLAYYPAFVFYFLFIWIELFGETSPKSLSSILLGYSALNLIGVFLWGKGPWFKYCEFFSVFFKILGKIAPFEHRENKLYLRPPLVGLLKEKPEHFSLLLFILFMLSSTAFDGFKSTAHWLKLVEAVGADRSYLTLKVADTLGLALSPFLFLYIYLALICATQLVTKSKATIRERSLDFAFSLVPIAFVYNIAHYYSLILTEGQNAVKFVSDPLGLGWNLFGTARYQTNYTFIDANIGWHLQVAFILLGHIAGVYLAHVIALRVYPNQKQALLSQFPMLALMVIYTVIGLWILAQPIVADMVR